MIEAIGVIVPVHDEAEHLAQCLAAIEGAFATLPSDMARLAVVVLDSCTDGSEAIAHQWRDAIARDAAVVLTVDHRNVGKARAAGMDHLLSAFSATPRSRLWLATTDADSEVPHTWLVDQIRMAAEGADAIAGSIRVADWSDYPVGFGAAFQAFYEPPDSDDAHPHVHGANLGVRADAYLDAGGFEPLRTGEDHALWAALHRVARIAIASRRIAVTTSARLRARAPDGFSGFLANFALAPAPART